MSKCGLESYMIDFWESKNPDTYVVLYIIQEKPN